MIASYGMEDLEMRESQNLVDKYLQNDLRKKLKPGFIQTILNF